LLWVGCVTSGAQRSCATFVGAGGWRARRVAGATAKCSGPQDDRWSVESYCAAGDWAASVGCPHWRSSLTAPPRPMQYAPQHRLSQTAPPRPMQHAASAPAIPTARASTSSRWPSTSPKRPQRSSGHPVIARPQPVRLRTPIPEQGTGPLRVSDVPSRSAPPTPIEQGKSLSRFALFGMTFVLARAVLGEDPTPVARHRGCCRGWRCGQFGWGRRSRGQFLGSGP
jgi:hypothetical protein